MQISIDIPIKLKSTILTKSILLSLGICIYLRENNSQWGEYMVESRMKISIITDISVLEFYGCIRYIEDILIDILIQNIDKQKNWSKLMKI